MRRTKNTTTAAATVAAAIANAVRHVLPLLVGVLLLLTLGGCKSSSMDDFFDLFLPERAPAAKIYHAFQDGKVVKDQERVATIVLLDGFWISDVDGKPLRHWPMTKSGFGLNRIYFFDAIDFLPGEHLVTVSFRSFLARRVKEGKFESSDLEDFEHGTNRALFSAVETIEPFTLSINVKAGHVYRFDLKKLPVTGFRSGPLKDLVYLMEHVPDAMRVSLVEVRNTASDTLTETRQRKPRKQRGKKAEPPPEPPADAPPAETPATPLAATDAPSATKPPLENQ